MRSTDQSELRTALAGLPDGWGCAPLFPVHGPAPVQVCAIVARPEAGGGVGGVGPGGLVLIRDLFDARLVLGCIVDAAYQPIEWLEIEIQDPRGVGSSPGALREGLTNATLDEAFIARQNRGPDTGRLTLGCEGVHPPPTWIRPDTLDPVMLPDHEKGGWLLCRDDDLLAAAELPGYRASLHRYLYCPGLGEESPLISLTDDAPTSERTIELRQALSDAGMEPDSLLPLNPMAGLITCRRYHPVPILGYAAAIGGRSWDQVMHGRPAIRALAGSRAMSASADRIINADGRIFTARGGRNGRIAEALHLKLRLINTAIQQVIEFAQRTRLPLLTLTDESFRVRLLDDPVPGMPVLWSGRSVLVEAGGASRAVTPDGVELYVPTMDLSPSIYRPEDVTRAGRGQGAVVLRSVEDTPDGQAIITATLKVDDTSAIRPDDWVWLRPTVGERRISLMGVIDEASALATGEVRFRTAAQTLDAPVLDDLRRVSGVQLNDVPFETIARLGAACDLYSLGVLALRILLTGPVEGEETDAPAETIDEAMSLAREAGTASDGQPLEGRLAQLLRSDERWVRRLGPQRLIDDELSARQALECIPVQLWARVLGFCLRLLPGGVPESFTSALGDGAGLPPIAVVTRPDEHMATLLEQSRALLFGDWNSNREIHAILGRVRGKIETS